MTKDATLAKVAHRDGMAVCAKAFQKIIAHHGRKCADSMAQRKLALAWDCLREAGGYLKSAEIRLKTQQEAQANV